MTLHPRCQGKHSLVDYDFIQKRLSLDANGYNLQKSDDGFWISFQNPGLDFVKVQPPEVVKVGIHSSLTRLRDNEETLVCLKNVVSFNKKIKSGQINCVKFDCF